MTTIVPSKWFLIRKDNILYVSFPKTSIYPAFSKYLSSNNMEYIVPLSNKTQLNIKTSLDTTTQYIMAKSENNFNINLVLSSRKQNDNKQFVQSNDDLEICFGQKEKVYNTYTASKWYTWSNPKKNIYGFRHDFTKKTATTEKAFNTVILNKNNDKFTNVCLSKKKDSIIAIDPNGDTWILPFEEFLVENVYPFSEQKFKYTENYALYFFGLQLFDEPNEPNDEPNDYKSKESKNYQ